MLQVLHEHDDPALMERVWRFRYQRFVEQLGWEAVRRPDCWERDQFDGPAAVHLVLEHDKQIVGYSRLLPTSVPYLAADLYPSRTADLPTKRYPFEWTRCAAISAASINDIKASDILMTGVLECLLALGARDIVFLTYPRVIAMMKRRGYRFDRIETVSVENGTAIQLAAAGLSRELLELHRKRYRICRSVLRWRGVFDRDGDASSAAA